MVDIMIFFDLSKLFSSPSNIKTIDNYFRVWIKKVRLHKKPLARMILNQ
jgi:hypothetical protein